jgi:WD40 repeat protein
MSATPQATPERPWLGLLQFAEADSEYFFGRDAEIAELRDRVLRSPLTVLYGVSGYGKSSLLGAGLIPALRGEGYLPIPLPRRFVFDDPDFHPVAQALTVIDAALAGMYEEGQTMRTAISVIRDARSGTITVAPATLWEFFHDRSMPWWNPVEPEYVQPVLIFDQFEDFFTQGEDKGGACAAAARDFLTALADLVENRPPAAVRELMKTDRTVVRAYDFTSRPVKVVLALREDFLSRLERWRRVMPSLVENRVELRLLSGPQALRAVIGSAGKRTPPIVDENTGAAIVRFVAGAVADVPLEEIDNVPPLLSLICAQLNERRFPSPHSEVPDRADIPLGWVRTPTPQAEECATANRSGELRTAAEEVLERFYAGIFAEHPAAVRHFVEDELVSDAGFRETVTLDTGIAKLRAAGVPHPHGALNRLVDQRLLVIEERNGVSRIELSHDILATLALRSRKDREQHEEAANRARELLARRGARVRAVIVAVILLLAIAALAGAWRARLEAERAGLEAKRAEAAVAENRKLLQSASIDDYAVALQRIEKEGRWQEGVAYLARALKCQPDNLLAAARLYSVIAFYVPEGAEKMESVFLHNDAVDDASFSPDGTKIVTASDDGTARIWDVVTGKAIGKPLRHEGRVNSASFSPDGSKIVTASEDHTARVWDANTGKAIGEPLQHEDHVNLATFSPDGSKIVTASGDHRARIWDVATGKPLGEPLRHEDVVRSAYFSPDGSKIITASDDKTALIWDAATGRPLCEPFRHVAEVNDARFSPDGSKIVTASDDKTAIIWDVATGKPVGEPLRHESYVVTACFSPDGINIVTAGWDNTARVWDAASHKPLGLPLRHDSDVNSATFSPDGSKIVTASDDKTARIWNVAALKGSSTLLRHEAEVNSASFSPDGSKIVTASSDKTAIIWDGTTGKPLGEPMRHQDAVGSASFSPDGSRIVTREWHHCSDLGHSHREALRRSVTIWRSRK